jgi:hypothetical protein
MAQMGAVSHQILLALLLLQPKWTRLGEPNEGENELSQFHQLFPVWLWWSTRSLSGFTPPGKLITKLSNYAF